MKIHINTENLDELKSLVPIYPILGIIYTILIMWFYPQTNILITILFPLIICLINYGPLVALILINSIIKNKNVKQI
jgi:hypothetical protein